MSKYAFALVALSFLLALSLTTSSAHAWWFNGTTSNTTRDRISSTNITIIGYNMSFNSPPSETGSWSVLSNGTGDFNLSVSGSGSDSDMFKPVIRKYNGAGTSAVYTSQPLPQLFAEELRGLGSINFIMKEGATVNITAISDPTAIEGNISHVSSSSITGADHYLGLEWMSENSTWAYVNTTANPFGDLVIVNQDMTANHSYPTMSNSMRGYNVLSFEYVGNETWYFVNRSATGRIWVNQWTADSLTHAYDITGDDNLIVEGIVYNGTHFILSVKNTGFQAYFRIYNSTFSCVHNTSMLISGQLEYSDEKYYLITNNSEQYSLNEMTGHKSNEDSFNQHNNWEMPDKSAAGIVYNGSDMFYASPEDNTINRFEIYTQNVSFGYMIKDQGLGYPVEESFNTQVQQATVFVSADRNYSVMIYPQRSMPVGYNLNIDAVTSSPKVAQVRFNTSEISKRVSGYVSYGGTDGGFQTLNIVAYLMEAGNMIHEQGTLPYNMSSWDSSDTDYFDATTGLYNITLPAKVNTSSFLLLAIAYNGSDYFGNYVNITPVFDSSEEELNISVVDLAGEVVSTVSNLKDAQNWDDVTVPVQKAQIQFNNYSSGSAISSGGHIEIELDYTDVGGAEFTWMADLEDSDSGIINLTLLEHNIKTINMFSQTYAPRETKVTATDLQTQPTVISLKSFQPEKVGGDDLEDMGDLLIDMLISNATCDVPNPPEGCSLFPQGQEKEFDDFDPFLVVLGGGDISFRMKLNSTGITVHYKLVDLMASGPPDALFDEEGNKSEATGSVMEEAWRFGSQGPKIYSEVLIGFPYNSTAMDETKDINLTVNKLYDEDNVVMWDQDVNGTGSQYPNSNNGTNLTDYSGFDTGFFDGLTCNKSDSTLASGNCYADTSNNMIWIVIPHFSTVGTKYSGDPNLPVIDVNSPSDHEGFTSDNQTIYFNFTDNGHSTASCTLYVNISGTETGVATNSSALNATNTSLSTGALPDGEYDVYVNCTNGAGYTGQSSSINITIAADDPSASVTSPANNSYSKSVSNTFIITCSDNNGISYAQIWMNGTSNVWELNETNTSFTTGSSWAYSTLLVDGTLLWSTWCNDTYGNSTWAGNYTLTVDTVTPSMGNETSSSVDHDSAVISWDSTEECNSSVTYGTNTDLNASNGTTTSATFTASNSVTLSLSASTTYYYNVTSCDRADNCNTTGPWNLTTSAAPATTTDDSGSSGGGGGGGSTTTLPKVQKSWDAITAGTAVTMSVTDERFSLKSVEVKTGADSSGGLTSYDHGTSRPSSTSEPSGSIYNYFEIGSTIPEADLSEATITFEVNQSWFSENSLDHTKVRVLRDVDGTWTEIEASLTYTGTSTYTYTATLPGFSYFAITADPIEEAGLCTPDAKRCVGNDLQQCRSDGTAWEKLETCGHGCDASTLECKPAPPEAAGEGTVPGEAAPEAGEAVAIDTTTTYIAMAVIIIAIIAAAAYFLVLKPKGVI